MPGGRLTYQDRQRIAEQLAQGRGFAEIARDLRRPTSTVSREVNRNGGQGGYLAAEAHQLSTQRSRGHTPSTPRIRPALPDPDLSGGYGRDPEQVRDFQRRFTAMMVQTGFPPMMARVLVSLYTCDSGSLTAAELTHRLNVSAASVSKAVQNLEDLGMVRRTRDPNGRREHYFIERDVWDRAWAARARLMEKWVVTALQGSELMGPDTPVGIRLSEMSEFLGCIRRDLGKTSEEWQRRCAEQDKERAERT